MNAAQRMLLLVDLLTDERAAVYARDQRIAELTSERDALRTRVEELEDEATATREAAA